MELTTKYKFGYLDIDNNEINIELGNKVSTMIVEGATGSGKTRFTKSLIDKLLESKTTEEVPNIHIMGDTYEYRSIDDNMLLYKPYGSILHPEMYASAIDLINEKMGLLRRPNREIYRALGTTKALIRQEPSSINTVDVIIIDSYRPGIEELEAIKYMLTYGPGVGVYLILVAQTGYNIPDKLYKLGANMVTIITLYRESANKTKMELSINKTLKPQNVYEIEIPYSNM